MRSDEYYYNPETESCITKSAGIVRKRVYPTTFLISRNTAPEETFIQGFSRLCFFILYGVIKSYIITYRSRDRLRHSVVTLSPTNSSDKPTGFQ